MSDDLEVKPKNAWAEKLAKQTNEEQKKFQKSSKRRIVYLFIVVGVLLVVVGFFLWNWSFRGPRLPDQSQYFESLGREHMNPGASHPGYNSNPPTSGWHYSKTAVTDFYEEEVPDEYLIHNLEHGDIWIAYHPRIPDEVKKQLKSRAGGKIVVTSRSQNEYDISLVAWQRLDSFNVENGVLNQERLNDFIDRYMNKGPEKVPTGMQGGATKDFVY